MQKVTINIKLLEKFIKDFIKENNLKLYILYDTSKKSLEDLKSFIINNCQPGGFNE